MTEQQPYELVQRYAHFELRRYPAYAVAEIEVNATFDRAGNAAFRPLFNYISGSNTAQRKLAMTAPVIQEPGASQKLAMTAPAAHRPDLPEPWVWDRDPWQVAAAIAAGRDPVDVPHADVPVLVYREPGGRLATAFAG